MHRVMRSGVRATLVLPVVFALMFTSATAWASMAAVAKAQPQVSSASWGATVASAGGLPGTGAYVMLWLSGTAVQYFDVVNTGSLALLSTTWSVTNDVTSGAAAAPEITFDACTGGSWDPVTAACSGTVVRLGATRRGTLSLTSSTTATEPGSRLSVRALTSNVNFPASYTSTINLSVSRAQAQAATTTSS